MSAGKKEPASEYLLAGYTLLFAITELLSLYHDFYKAANFHLLTVTYGAVAGVLAFLGVRSLYKKRQKESALAHIAAKGRSCHRIPELGGAGIFDSDPGLSLAALLCPYG
ncbi:MAG: DUF6077 domain-containing protein [Ruminococcus sp.]